MHPKAVSWNLVTMLPTWALRGYHIITLGSICMYHRATWSLWVQDSDFFSLKSSKPSGLQVCKCGLLLAKGYIKKAGFGLTTWIPDPQRIVLTVMTQHLFTRAQHAIVLQTFGVRIATCHHSDSHSLRLMLRASTAKISKKQLTFVYARGVACRRHALQPQWP